MHNEKSILVVSKAEPEMWMRAEKDLWRKKTNILGEYSEAEDKLQRIE